MISGWSDEVRLMFRPLVMYRQLVARPDNGGFRLSLQRPIFVALAFGAFVSLTVAARLTIPLLLEGAFFWSFVPILQVVLVAGVVLTFARGQISIPKALDLFFMGYGPCLGWMLGIAGSCLFLPLKEIYLWPTETGWIMPVSLLGTWLWSNIINFAFLRGGLRLTAAKAVTALLLYTMMFWGIILSYLFAVESLQLHRLQF